MTGSGLPWMTLCYFGLAMVSAVFPWVNAEIIVLSIPAVASSKTVLLVLVLIATAGQMTGKCVLYWAGRNGNKVLRGRAGQAVPAAARHERVQDRIRSGADTGVGGGSTSAMP